MSRSKIMRRHPNLRTENFKIKSAYDEAYNCVAFAAGDTERWWWPSDDDYWPEDAPREETVQAFVRAFNTLGYHNADNADLEAGFEKVALYAWAITDELQVPRHMARQTQTGRWICKLGDWEDIEHQTLAGLEDARYGTVVRILKRPVAPKRRRRTA